MASEQSNSATSELFSCTTIYLDISDDW